MLTEVFVHGISVQHANPSEATMRRPVRAVRF
jgi:hypothetical protein